MPSLSPKPEPVAISLLRGDAPDVAPLLLGALIFEPATGVTLRILETEAYMADDPASHSFRGRTKRNDVMFGEPGHWYVYFVYGMHWCLNVVTGIEGDGQAVLIRAAEVVSGWPIVADRRGVDADLLGRRRLAVTDGPAKLAAALGVTSHLNATSSASGPLRLISDGRPLGVHRQTRRVGISVGLNYPWRFCAEGAPNRKTS